MAERLDPRLVEILRSRLTEVASHTIQAVTEEVPSYAGAFGGPMGATIEQAVEVALAGFLRLASRGRAGGTPQSPGLEGAYALGRGEARSGRSVDALLSAYRVGARVAWREMAQAAVEAGVDAGTVARFAELVFAYIDELSAASVAGHTDEIETTGRVRERYRDLLAQALLRGANEATVVAAADRADWKHARTLTAVIVPRAQVRPVLGLVSPLSLNPTSELAGLPEDRGVVLVADMSGRSRVRLLRLLRGRHAIVGPARSWREVRMSYLRALRTQSIAGLSTGTEPVDTEARLAELVLSADPDALADLRSRVLAPLADLKPSARDKLVETLRAWLLHHGRREEIATALYVHPQTVRYRMGQLRELYGDRLEDPDWVRDLTIALA